MHLVGAIRIQILAVQALTLYPMTLVWIDHVNTNGYSLFLRAACFGISDGIPIILDLGARVMVLLGIWLFVLKALKREEVIYVGQPFDS